MDHNKIMNEKENERQFISPGAFLESTKPASETLDDQIERLNKYIESLMNPAAEKESDFSSPSQFHHKTMSSLELDDASEINGPVDEEYLERFAHSLDRALMAKEDYRSSELRRQDCISEFANLDQLAVALSEELGTHLPAHSFKGLVDGLKHLMHSEITCSLFELYKLHSGVQQMISLAEDGLCFEGSFSLGASSFLVKVLRPESVFVSKEQLMFGVDGGTLKTPPADERYVKMLERKNRQLNQQLLIPSHVEKIGRELQATMEQEFEASIKDSIYALEVTNTCNIDNRSKNPAKMQMELRHLKQTKNEHESLKKNLEWEYSEISMIKNAHRMRDQEVLQRKAFLDKQSQLIKQRVIQLEKDREKFEKEIEEFEVDKKHFRDYQETNRISIAKIKNEIHDLMSVEETTAEKRPQSPYSNRNRTPDRDDQEINELKGEISRLETDLAKAKPEAKDSINIKLNRCKTQLSTLRSQMAISHSFHTSNSIRTAMNNVERKWEADERRKKRIKTHREQSPKLSFASTRSDRDKANVRTHRELSPKLSFVSDESEKDRPRVDTLASPRIVSTMEAPKLPPMTKIEPVQNRVELEEKKEIEDIKKRLAEREKKMREQEKYLKESWMHIPGADKLIPLIQKETRRLEEKETELNKCYQVLDFEKEALLHKSTHLKVSEQEIKTKLREVQEQVNGMYYRRMLVDQKLSSAIDHMF